MTLSAQLCRQPPSRRRAFPVSATPTRGAVGCSWQARAAKGGTSDPDGALGTPGERALKLLSARVGKLQGIFAELDPANTGARHRAASLPRVVPPGGGGLHLPIAMQC